MSLSTSVLPLQISLIAAIGKKRELGCNNQLIWCIREDQQNFKRLTLGHAILMGRKTYESIGRPLAGRTNLVLTRDTTYIATGCRVVHTLDVALSEAQSLGETELFVCGGAEIYAQAMPHATRMYLSWIEAAAPADTFFPAWNASQWRAELEVSFPAKDAAPAWRYQVLERVSR